MVRRVPIFSVSVASLHYLTGASSIKHNSGFNTTVQKGAHYEEVHTRSRGCFDRCCSRRLRWQGTNRQGQVASGCSTGCPDRRSRLIDTPIIDRIDPAACISRLPVFFLCGVSTNACVAVDDKSLAEDNLMQASVRKSGRAVQSLLFAMSLSAVLAACSPDKELDLASPATSEQPEIPVQAAAPSYSSAASQPVAGPDARRTNTRPSRAAAVQPKQEDVYYIEFRSRSAASYGHTFASVGKLDRAGNIDTSEIVGLHPATESVLPWMIGHVLPVPSETGASDGDTEEKYWTARYRVRMDKKRYDEMMSSIRELQASSPAWHAVFYNCNAFVGDIARLVGLKAPDNTMLFPKEYIEELATLNGA
jgi:hypothetical protein